MTASAVHRRLIALSVALSALLWLLVPGAAGAQAAEYAYAALQSGAIASGSVRTGRPMAAGLFGVRSPLAAIVN